jgi:hypothetical protein
VTARLLLRARIVARRPSPAGYATAADLDLAFDGPPAPAGERRLIHAADFGRERALYTLHTPDGLDAALRAPFLYAAALDHAVGILSVPFERLGEWRAHRALSPCFVHSPGRTGSTLLVRLLRAAGYAAASEPDWFTQLCLLDTATQHAIGPRMRASLVAAGVASLASVLGPAPFIKLRSQCNAAPELLSCGADGARAVLMLRRRRDWSLSRWRAFREPPERMGFMLREAVAVFERLSARGKPPLVLWYEDLVADPVRAMCSLVPGFSADDACRERIAGVMRCDSQAGTSLARRPAAADAGEAAFAAAFDAAWKDQALQAGGSPQLRALLERLENVQPGRAPVANDAA